MDGFVILESRFASLVLPNAPLQLLAEGFAWTEGPVWFADHQALLFSDVPNDRILRWTEAGVSVFRSPSQFSNGQTRDREGRLITCSHRGRNIVRTELDGNVTVLVDRFAGKRLNSPNDVVVKSDGAIWFSDPHYGINTDYEGGIVADDFDGPNGLCFSPDETQLYICESGKQFAAAPRRCIRAFALEADGKSLRPGSAFYKVDAGFSDGVCCDALGNVWSSAGDGVHCISPDGALLGKILVPDTVSNLTFGGRNLSRLFICAGPRLYAIYTNTRGIAFPPACR
jgi:gluconolactonase